MACLLVGWTRKETLTLLGSLLILGCSHVERNIQRMWVWRVERGGLGKCKCLRGKEEEEEKEKRKRTQERKWADRRKECVPIRIVMFVGIECTHFRKSQKT